MTWTCGGSLSVFGLHWHCNIVHNLAVPFQNWPKSLSRRVAMWHCLIALIAEIAAGPVKVLESISLAFFSLTVSKYVGKRCNDWLLNPTSNATNLEDM